MKNKKKSFYFQDYNESELNEDYKSNILKISLNRVTFLSFIFFSLMLIFSIKIIYISLSSGKNFYVHNIKKDLIKKRRDIVDRNGTVLATNVILYNVGVRPKLLSEKEKKNLIIKLGISFSGLDLNIIRSKLNKDDFFSIGKRLTPKEKEKYWLMGNKSLVFDSIESRIYPQKNLFSHVLGQTDDANEGISGVEKFFDRDLNNTQKSDFPLRLTLDSNLQYLIRKELIKAELDFKNIGSAAILMDVENGEILSLVSLPDYDLNKRVSIKDNAYANFTIAAGFENRVVN